MFFRYRLMIESHTVAWYAVKMKMRIVIFALVLFAVYITAGFMITNILMGRYFARSDKRNFFSPNLVYDSVASELPREEISFLSGSAKLSGALYGHVNAEGIVVIVHGYGGDMDSHIASIAYFVQHGWRVLAYSGTGVGSSEGDSRVNLYQSVTDLRAALSYIKDAPATENLPVVLFGHSQGAFAACAVFNYAESLNVKAVVSFAGMNNASDMIDVYGRNIAGAFYPLLKPFAYIINDTDYSVGADKNAVNGINGTDIPFMLIQGMQDTVVSPDSTAITHFSGDITNPNVEVLFLSDEWNSGHQGIFYSKSAVAYRNEVNASLEPYRLLHGIDVFTDDDLRAWAAEIRLDRTKYNEINHDVFDAIIAFYENAIRQ